MATILVSCKFVVYAFATILRRLYYHHASTWLFCTDKYSDTLQVLLRALRDFNLGKLTADDTGIFLGLLNDIFPQTLDSVPRALNHDFEAYVSSCPIGSRLPLPIYLSCTVVSSSLYNNHQSVWCPWPGSSFCNNIAKLLGCQFHMPCKVLEQEDACTAAGSSFQASVQSIQFQFTSLAGYSLLSRDAI